MSVVSQIVKQGKLIFWFLEWLQEIPTVASLSSVSPTN